MSSIFELQEIAHRYDDAAVISLPHLAAKRGEHTLVLGMSGSGKSTLLHIMAGVLRPSQGTVHVLNRDLYSLKGHQLDRFRGAHIGIVFQQMHLLPALTVEENVRLALYLSGKSLSTKRLRDVLAGLDLFDKAKVYPHQLSEGQKQRACIARAVINEPALILADEPTASLDDVRCAQVLKLLISQAETYGATLVIATHDQRIKPYFSNHLSLTESSPKKPSMRHADVS
ncbi:MAG: ABC transporter ATP-binding protein [Rhodothermales bacterium]